MRRSAPVPIAVRGATKHHDVPAESDPFDDARFHHIVQDSFDRHHVRVDTMKPPHPDSFDRVASVWMLGQVCVQSAADDVALLTDMLVHRAPCRIDRRIGCLHRANDMPINERPRIRLNTGIFLRAKKFAGSTLTQSNRSRKNRSGFIPFLSVESSSTYPGAF
jgi:hypothetical protein